MDDTTPDIATDDDTPSSANGPSANGSGMTPLDRKLAGEAYKKVLEGKELTSREQTLLKRVEKEKEERLRWQYYNSIPQKHWREMSGRQTKVLNEQAARYGIPFGGAYIRLADVARALHDFLAENAVKLAKDDDPLMQGTGSPALERYREERALLARLDRLERERNLVPRDEVRQALGRIATIVRGVGDTLQRQYGVAALEVLFEALDDAEREIVRSFGEGTDDSSSEQPADPPHAE